MNRIKFQIVKLPRNFNTAKATNLQNVERIDSLLMNFEESVREMKRFLQERGFSRRHFFHSDHPKISETFDEKSERFKEIILNRADELGEWEFSKSILSLGSIYRWKESEILFQRAKLHFPSSSDIFSSMIYAYGKVGKYHEALKVFEEIVAVPSCQITRKMFEGLLEAYSVHVERQILIANALDERSLESSNSLYRQAHSARVLNEISMEPAVKIYNQLLELKFNPSISTITRIIRLAGRLRRFDVVEDMQRECERFSLKFDSQALEVLIFAQMQCGRSEEAEESFSQHSNILQSEDLSRILNVMLFGYCRLRRPLEAKRLLETFKIEPGPSALSYLVGTSAKCGFINDAENFFLKLKMTSKQKLLIPAANHLLSAHLKNNNHERFFELIDELGPDNRDRYTNTMIFDALNRSRLQSKDLSRLSKEIEQTKIHLKKANLSSMELSALFNCLFTHFEGDDISIKDFIKYAQGEIKERSNESKRELQIILLDVFSKQTEWDGSIEIVRDLLVKSDDKIDPLIFAKLMRTAGPNPERIEFVLKWMTKAKCWRDPSILVSAMELYWKAGCSKESRELWEEIRLRRNKARWLSVAIGIFSDILLKEEGPLRALNHLNSFKNNLWNDFSLQIYLKSLRLSSSTSLKEISELFFDRIVKMNPLPSVNVCNEVLISVLTNSETVESVINWMSQNGCHPNYQTVNILTANGNENNLKFAQKLVDEMVKAGAKPSDELLLRMITGQLEMNHISEAEIYSKILVERRAAGTEIQIKLQLYPIWIRYFEKIGKTTEAERVKEEFEKLNG